MSRPTPPQPKADLVTTDTGRMFSWLARTPDGRAWLEAQGATVCGPFTTFQGHALRHAALLAGLRLEDSQTRAQICYDLTPANALTPMAVYRKVLRVTPAHPAFTLAGERTSLGWRVISIQKGRLILSTTLTGKRSHLEWADAQTLIASGHFTVEG